MGRGLVVVLLAAVVGGALAVSGTARTTGGGTPERATFRLADGSAGCTYDRGELACGSRDTGGAWVDSATVLAPDRELVARRLLLPRGVPAPRMHVAAQVT